MISLHDLKEENKEAKKEEEQKDVALRVDKCITWVG